MDKDDYNGHTRHTQYMDDWFKDLDLMVVYGWHSLDVVEEEGQEVSSHSVGFVVGGYFTNLLISSSCISLVFPRSPVVFISSLLIF